MTFEEAFKEKIIKQYISETKYLYFKVYYLKDRKTPIIIVTNKQEEILGEIYYYPQWRKFVFNPEADIIFDTTCLNDISAYMNILT